ncbi:hypothetical protein XHC_4215 [Xanthomonas hortorum pv. carotae str. M081]|nr:hypothetical protein XHC_4215 [Xanthomonas hortorum pv. carotae str. M081]
MRFGWRAPRGPTNAVAWACGFISVSGSDRCRPRWWLVASRIVMRVCQFKHRFASPRLTAHARQIAMPQK